MIKNILITGGAGFVGSNAVHYFKQARPNVNLVVYDKLTYSGNPKLLENLDVTLIQGDICNKQQLDSVVRRYKIDTIIHYAAETHVDNSISTPEVFIKTNIEGTYNILEVTREHDLVMIHISTDEVFGDLEIDSSSQFTPESPYKPSSPYSASKAAADHLVRAWIRTYGIKAILTNCSNIYGPRQNKEKLIPRQIINALENRPFTLYGDGLNVRDWIHVEDHARAILAILERGTYGETYLIGARNEQSNISIVRALQVHFKDNPITYVKDRPGHDRRYAIDPSKLESELGWHPKHTNMEHELGMIVEWYRNNEWFWK